MGFRVIEAAKIDDGSTTNFQIQLDNSKGEGRVELAYLGIAGVEYFLDLGIRCTSEKQKLRIETIVTDFERFSTGVIPGLISGWNATHLQVVEPGDYITSVNGKSDLASMQEELRSKKQLVIEVGCSRSRPRVSEQVLEISGNTPSTIEELRQRIADSKCSTADLLLLSCRGGQQPEDTLSLASLGTSDICLTDFSNLVRESRRGPGRTVEQIAEVELRGITLLQIQDLVSVVRNRCTMDSNIVGWYDVDKESATYGRQLVYETLDFFQVSRWVTEPISRRAGCSYVEVVADDPVVQAPMWFASHAWATPLVNFAACLECQAYARSSSPARATFWVDVFASSDAGVGRRGGELQSSFVTGISRSLSRCAGMLLVVDDHGAHLSRAWCCAEELLAVASRVSAETFLVDLVTVHSAGATLLADGLTQKDGPGGSAWMRKIARESKFPAAVLDRALEIDAEKIIVTSDARRSSFLASLSAASLTPETLNKQLHANFAVRAWRQALQETSLRKKILEKLKSQSTKREFTMNFAGCSKSFDDTHMSELAEVLPVSPLSLDLGFYACSQITSDGLITLGKSLPTSIESLRLEFWWCRNIGDWGVRGIASGFPSGLTNLVLSLEDCHLIGNEGVSWMSERFPQALKTLDLNLWNCTRIGDSGLKRLAEDLPSGLIELSLTLYCWDKGDSGAKSANQGVTDKGIGALANGLPPGLKKLSLAFVFCDGITDDGVDTLVAALPQALDRIDFDFRGCSRVSQAKQSLRRGQAESLKPVSNSPTPEAVEASNIDTKQADAKTPDIPPHPMTRVIDMFRSADLSSSGTMQRRHLFYLLQLLYPSLTDSQFQLLLRSAGLPLTDTIHYEKLLTWLYDGS
mmetsp:Transcript_18434/g.29919  ORF Transcript_18434/g.29919 Transcript_18434/m.29919 type:complete len:865 (+) Transcript_18434:51-2645(+)